MARKRPGLGKGLDALIPTGEEKAESSSGVVEVSTEKINPNPRQPRAQFSPEGISELAASIKEHGIIQPLIVTKNPQSNSYTLIAGERRLLAAKEAEMDTVPVLVREANDQDRLELALIENVQRADLNPLEAAEAYRQLVEDFGLSHSEIADRVGKNRVTITNTLRLLKVTSSVQEALVKEQISEGHARALLSLDNAKSQAAALQTIIQKGLNVRQTEALVRKLTGEKPQKKTKPSAPPEIKALEEQLRAALGTKVRLKHGDKGGTLTIYYYSDEELDTLINMILQE